MKKFIICHLSFIILPMFASATLPVDRVDPFIGTTNFAVTNPGAVCPHGMISVVPFNVMGGGHRDSGPAGSLNVFDKDSRWWSAPYEIHNQFFTGYSHVNLSGVGCPEVGSILVMPTTGELGVDYRDYGSTYTDESATPGYYSNRLTKYDVATEVTATLRAGVHRYTFPAGKRANILVNLGEGLTNETGAWVRFVPSADGAEIEGMRLAGGFCYTSQAVFPIYFVLKVSEKPSKSGLWKKQKPMTAEAEWDSDQGRYKIYDAYTRDIAGDDIGAWFSFNNTHADRQLEVRIGVSFVSTENARANLEAETAGKTFAQICEQAREKWNDDLSRITVEGGTDDQQKIFYTALSHALIHPSVFNDVNGQYPAMESGRTMTAEGYTRYTVFSLWDTYRNVHQLLTLAYPERQVDMVRSMIAMQREWGWMPKWELYGRETWTMEGDPSIPVITDTWLKGLRGFDINEAYDAFYRSATLPGNVNLMRPDNTDYMRLGYVPLREPFDNSVSHALEYYVADNALSLLAQNLGKTKDAALFKKRSLGYRHYYSPEFGCFRPILPNGKFLTPFNPLQGADFEPNPGFHEGNAWNYTFYVPHDVLGLAKLMGGPKKFVDKLEAVFANGWYDPANEPDIAYAHLFSYFKGEEWRTQKHVRELLDKYYTTAPDGLPGNDDAGTMSAWAIFNMMGIYPDCPGSPYYTIVSPVFDRVTIGETLTIETQKESPDAVYVEAENYRISHAELMRAGRLQLTIKN